MTVPKWFHYFNGLILCLILISIVLISVALFGNIDETTSRRIVLADNIIVIFFVIDLIVEYYIISNWKKFLKYCWLDIIAILPLGIFFRVFKLAKVVRFVRLIRELPKAERAIVKAERAAVKATRAKNIVHIRRFDRRRKT